MIKRKIALIMAVAVISNISASAITVLAEEKRNGIISNEVQDININYGQTYVDKFESMKSINFEEYNRIYRMDKNNIKSIKTNGGNSLGGPIEHAVDGDINTFWHTAKLNSSTFTNEVVIEFNESEVIDRIVYGNRRQYERGFAEEFTIYGSNTSSGDDFVELINGSYANTQDFIEIKFDEAELKRIKFVFNKGSHNWASASEIWFYKEDQTSNKMKRLFKDGTKTALSEEFNTLDTIEALENEAKEHLLYDVFKEDILDAKALASDNIKYVQSELSIFNAINSSGFNKYNEDYRVDKSNIKSIKTNGGNSLGGPIEHAVDGDINTYWHTGKLNSSTFTNEVVIELNEREVIDRIVYGNRRGYERGFAEEFTIYASNTTSGDNFVNLTDGQYKNTQDFIEIKFNPTEVKRIKFVFNKGSHDWASASEIWFYKEDQTSNKMKRLFTDSTCSLVSEEFATKEKLMSLEEEVKNHPLYDMFKVSLDDAKILLESNNVEATVSGTSKFTLYENESYNDLFRMDYSNIKSIKNNSGHYASQSIDKAIDGDINTYWETNKANGGDFNNEVEIEFDERVVLDRVIYGARPNDNKGFAEAFEIYGSNTSSGDTYQLISTGSHGVIGGLVQVKFNPTEFKRIKFKYKKSTQNWATATEFMFYKEDVLKKEITSIFVDKTMSELKEEYNSKEAIDALADKIVNHPIKEELQSFIDRAYKILDNSIDKESVKIQVPQLGDIHGNARRNLSMSSFGTNFITTGVMAHPGDVVEIYVEAKDGEPLPQIVFTQSQGHYGNWRRNYNLNPGYNKFVVPEIYDVNWSHKANKGGAIYILNPYTDQEQSKAPIVQIEGARKFPVYNVGDNEEEFLEELKSYKEYMDENPDTAVDIFEYNAPRILYTGTASDAYQVYVNEGIKVSDSINVWSDFTDKGYKFAGLEDNIEAPLHDSTNLRTAVRVMQPHGAAYAAGDHVGIQKHVADDFLRTGNSDVNGIIWGTMHEIGHQMDIPARTWGEVTNNMWANEMSILNGKTCRLNYQSLYNTVALNHNYDNLVYEEIGYTDMLGMFWQLELYKDGYWAEIERAYRERKPTVNNYQEKKDLFALYSSEIVGENLTEHFERYGFTLSEECKNELKKYPDLNNKIWYIHSDIMKYEGNGFTEGLSVNVSTKINFENKSNTLIFNVDEENKNNVLGYEISKDGKVIGFTRENTFIVNDIDVSENSAYEVRAYDIKLGTSEKVSVRAFEPKIKSYGNVTLKLQEEFNPLDYVQAFSYTNEDISSKLEFSHNVDTTKKGIYTLNITLTDNEATVNKSIPVEVVSEYDYLSDLEWKSVQTQWGTPRRNSGIKVRVDGEAREVEKGIGIHANGKLVYNLEGRDYDRFEALLGIDMSIVAQNKSSINFKVYGDGVELTSTNVLKHSDNAVNISVPVKGVNELTIEILNGNNGNESDHGVIANPKLIRESAKPVIEVEDTLVVKLGESNKDIIGLYTAMDAEDGDLTSQVTVEQNVNFNKTGVYEVIYSVVDSEGNKSTKTRTIKVIDMEDSIYLSDINWKSGSAGYGQIRKDLSSSGNKLRLTGENNEVITYEKGIGTHSTSNIVYDLTEMEYQYFTSYIGVDRQVYNSVGSITFEVWLDNKKVYDSGLMLANDKQKFIEINLEDAKEMRLVVTQGGNENWSDHANFADAKLHYINNDGVEVNKDDLNNLLNEIDILKSEDYTEESWNNLSSVKAIVLKGLADGYNQMEVDKYHNDLREAKNLLEEVTLRASLIKAVKYADTITDLSFVGTTTHIDKKWDNFITARDYSKEVLAKENPLDYELHRALDLLEYTIIELNIINKE